MRTNPTPWRTALCSLAACATLALPAEALTKADPPSSAVAKARVAFEENKGQIRTTTGDPAPHVRYRLSEGDAHIFLLPDGIAYQFTRMHYPPSAPLGAGSDPLDLKAMEALRKQTRMETYRMDMLLEGANPNATITTEGRSADHTNYYTHDALDIHTYTKVTYHGVYAGIDWIVYTTEKGMKYDFIVAPGADPAQIRLRFKHHEELKVQADGSLLHGNRMGRFTEEKPVSFQGTKEVATRFVLEGDLLRFAVEDYDRSKALTIDPARVWGAYYGGSGDDQAFSTAVDDQGNVYVTGQTVSTNGIAASGHQNSNVGGIDAYLAKFDPNGNRLWGTYYGGNNDDAASGCTTDASGNVYMVGYTNSSSGIAAGTGYDHTFAGGGTSDAILVKFDANGTRLWGTYYGDTGLDHAISCAVDTDGEVYISGHTASTTNIANNGHQNTYGGGSFDAFLAKFSANGIPLWSTYYGGADVERGSGCSTDTDGNVYLVGWTRSPTGIAADGHQNSYSGNIVVIIDGGDAFLAKFDTHGTRLWGTYYGGSGTEQGRACAVDPDGNVLLTGITQSSSGIASGGHQNTYNGNQEAYLAKFNANGVRQWATYYGTDMADIGLACATDAYGNVYMAGASNSTNGIAIAGHQNTFGGLGDGYLVKFSSAGTRLWGTYYGGIQLEESRACAVDHNGNVYLAGFTSSTNAIASGGHQNTYGGGAFDAVLVKFRGAAAQDCAGYWGGTASVDDCGVCSGGTTGVAPNSTCTQDCNGVWGGTAYEDNCENCVEGNTGLEPCVQDCNSDWGGTAYPDPNCGTCIGGNTGLEPCTQDCNNVWGGTAYMDDCETCVGGNTGLEPCVTCTENVTVELRTDANSAQASWQILAQHSDEVLCQYTVPVNGITTPIAESCCLPAGCYRLRVQDSGGDGFVSGGYQLRESGANGRRIIDNLGNFNTGSTSAIGAGYENGAFCLPIGDDKLIFSSCDKLDWTANKFIVVAENPAVSAQFGVSNANSGYEFWFFDPNGGYSFRRFRSHATSDGFGTGALRANHFKINGWTNSVATPRLPDNVLLNVRVRGRVAGSNLPFGPACLFKLDATLATCPRVKLQDDPANPADYSCGVTRSFGGGNTAGNRITANPPQPIPTVASSNVRYQFRFRIPGEGICIVRPPQTSARLVLNWTNGPALQCSKTYEVDVRVSLNGGATWCFGPAGSNQATTCADTEDWGKVCNVTISGCAQATGGSNSMAATDANSALTLYPNPNRGDQLFMRLNNVEEGVKTMSVDIYDLTGKRVVARTIAVADGFVNTSIDLGDQLSSGVYVVHITAGTNTHTERLVIAH